MRIRYLWLLIAGALTGSVSLFAQPTFEFVVVNKLHDFQQTGPSTVGETTEFSPWSLEVSVSGSGLEELTDTSFTAPSALVGIPLDPDTDDGGWEFESDFATQLALDAAFANGEYVLSVNGISVTLNLSGDAYPAAPLATFSQGIWSGSTLLIDPSQSLTITSSSYAGYGDHLNDRIGINVEGGASAETEQFWSDVQDTSFLALTIPAFSFVSGSSFDVEIEFNAIVDVSAELEGSLNVAVFSAITSVRVQAIPEPATWAGIIGTAALAGTVLVRRRRIGA